MGGGGSIVSRRNFLLALKELPKDWDRNLKPLRHGVKETTETEAMKIFEVLKLSAARRYSSHPTPSSSLSRPLEQYVLLQLCSNNFTPRSADNYGVRSAVYNASRETGNSIQHADGLYCTAPHCACASYPLTTRVQWKTLFSLKQVTAENIWNPLTIRGSRVDQLIPQPQ